MMRLRNWVSVVLAGTMCAGMLAGCGGQEKTATKDNEQILKAAASTEGTYDGKITMLFGIKDEYLSYLDQASKTYASMKNVELETIDCGESVDKQIEYTKAAVQDEVGALVVVLVDNSRTQDIIDAAGDIPVVFVNRCPADTTVLDEQHVYIGSNEEQAGAMEGDALVKELQRAGKTSVNYVLFKGNEGHDSTAKRSAGVLKALKEAGITANAAAEVTCDFNRTEAMNAMNDLISGGLDMNTVDCIISNNDAMALGALEACRLANIDTSNLVTVGVDGLNDGLRAVSDGEMAGTVYQNAAAQATAGMQTAINLANGEAALNDLNYETAEESV